MTCLKKLYKSEEDQELYEPESDNEDVLYIPTSNQEFSKMDIPQVNIKKKQKKFLFSILGIHGYFDSYDTSFGNNDGTSASRNAQKIKRNVQNVL